MAPSYKQNTAKIGEIHGTVNLRFKRPVHEGYMLITFQKTTVSGGTLVHSGLSLRNKLTLLLVAVSGKNVL